jgi:hypothetical protein
MSTAMDLATAIETTETSAVAANDGADFTRQLADERSAMVARWEELAAVNAAWLAARGDAAAEAAWARTAWIPLMRCISAVMHDLRDARAERDEMYRELVWLTAMAQAHGPCTPAGGAAAQADPIATRHAAPEPTAQ